MSTQEIFGKLTAHNNSPRPVPVYILADVSGSMAGLKVQNLNKAIAQMAQSFLADSDTDITFHMSVITFGSSAKLHIPLTPIERFSFTPLTTSGSTNLAGALKIAKELIEDRSKQPVRAMKPAVALISDGMPDRGYEVEFERFINEGKTRESQRFAVGIGSDADRAVLDRFQNIDEIGVLSADSAEDVVELLDRVRGYTTAMAQETSKMIDSGVSSSPSRPSAPDSPFVFDPISVSGQSSSILFDEDEDDDF